MIADPLSKWTPAAPTGTPRFNAYVRQNVAGLWLKYGAKSLKIETFPQSENLFPDATICWQQPLTTAIRRAYKPPTERGAVLALGQGMFSCPWSSSLGWVNQQPMTIGCHLPSKWGLRKASLGKKVSRDGKLPVMGEGFAPRAVWQVKMKKEKRGRRSPCESRLLEGLSFEDLGFQGLGFQVLRLDERLRRYTFT